MKLQQTLRNFGVGVTVTDISCGPSVTRYELQPEQGVKVSRIVSLADHIKLNLAAADIRIEAPIPGKAAVELRCRTRRTRQYICVSCWTLVTEKIPVPSLGLWCRQGYWWQGDCDGSGAYAASSDCGRDRFR